MMKNMSLSIEDTEDFCLVMKALSLPVRIKILELISIKSMSLNEIADSLTLATSTVAVNVKILEDAGLVMTTLQPGKRGSIKLCSLRYENLNLCLLKEPDFDTPAPFIASMPIGSYSDCEVHPTCGLVSENQFIGKDDDVSSFYHAKRLDAQLLWFSRGFVEYRFPRNTNERGEISSLQFSLEICSEAPNYRMHWPSDITVWIEGKEIGTWTCPGDFGGRQGAYTPSWWPQNSTQFGLLKTFTVTREGSFIDSKLVSDITLSELFCKSHNYISFKIGVKKDAHNLGGINIFGEKFGDFPQNISMRIDYA